MWFSGRGLPDIPALKKEKFINLERNCSEGGYYTVLNHTCSFHEFQLEALLSKTAFSAKPETKDCGPSKTSSVLCPSNTKAT